VTIVKRSAHAIGVKIEGCCMSMRCLEFMPNYLVWHQHREVQAPAGDESDGSDDEDRIDDTIADIGM
jgi:hypothetical protein